MCIMYIPNSGIGVGSSTVNNERKKIIFRYLGIQQGSNLLHNTVQSKEQWNLPIMDTFETSHFVLYREVVLYSEVKMY